MSTPLKSDRPAAQSSAHQDAEHGPFRTGVTKHGVPICDAEALTRARKSGAHYNDMTRQWDNMPALVLGPTVEKGG